MKTKQESMIKVIPKTSGYKQNYTSKTCVTFSSTSTTESNSPKDSFQKQLSENSSDKKLPFNIAPIKFPWVKNKNLIDAIDKLNKLEFDKNDVAQVQSMGVVLPFLSGKEAAKYIEDSKIEVKFAPMPSKGIHAQYDFEDNSIKINELYRNTQNPAVILAISEAILHESGHAKDKDSNSSLQEEMDCLAMNALAHRTLVKNNPDIFSSSDALIVKDGVSVYSDLFFDQSPANSSLVKRLNLKYGHLPVGDFKHPPSNIAMQSKS